MGAEFLSNYRPKWDLLLLDIEMPLMDGMTLAKRIREIDQDVLIIFITKMAQYAMSGYEVSALDYLLKPINYYAFSLKMKRVLKIIEARQTRNLVIHGNGFVHKISLDYLRYIDVLGHTITYHTIQENISSTGATSIKKLENNLANDGFIRCSRCYLVNLKFIQSVSGNMIILSNGEQISVSRNRKKDFMDALLDYWGK